MKRREDANHRTASAFVRRIKDLGSPHIDCSQNPRSADRIRDQNQICNESTVTFIYMRLLVA